MPVSDGYLTFVLDQLRTLLPVVRVRRMFGACGLYAGELFFAVIDDDTLYLKVDDETRGDYESRGMPAFQPMEGHSSMNYSQLPEELLEEPEALRPWVERAIEVARRAKTKGRKKRSAKTKSAPKGSKGSPRRR
jgi:DNA transformation protein